MAGYATTKANDTLENLGYICRAQTNYAPKKKELNEIKDKDRLKKSGYKTLWEATKERLNIEE